MTKSRSPVVANLPFVNVGNLVATAWKDNKVVIIALTLTDPLDHTYNHQQMTKGRYTASNTVSSVCTMKVHGGVDLGDQIRRSYHVHLKNRTIIASLFSI